MFKIVIVDDDEIIRKGIECDIPWEENGIKVAGSAKNGLEGLELVKELQPEIVLLDIKMPFMDGLEMAEQAAHLLPHLKVIFLTAYEDFDYAKKAVQLKVSGYVLKYEDKQIILSAVLKARDEWVAERKEREKIEKNNGLLINKLLGDLLSTVTNEQHMKEQAHSLGIDFQGDKFCLAAIGIDDYGSFSRTNNKAYLELAVHSILNVANEILFTYGKGMAFTKYNNYVNIIFNYNEDQDSTEIIYKILEDIAENTEKYLKISVSIGVGNIYDGLLNINLSYSEAINALEMRNIVGKKGIIPIDSVKYNENSQVSIFKKIVEFVNASYTENVTLSHISKEVHVSQSYICSIFRKYKNCTLSEYIIGIRIDKAKELLRHTEMKSYEVSEKVGYTNPQYFSMLFKKWTGFTPTEFKNL
jgi:two-component system response regulator YesN